MLQKISSKKNSLLKSYPRTNTSLAGRHFNLLILLSLCGLYLGFEIFFNHYAMFSVDEFWFAHRIFQYKTALPYRDFSPYKTVMGYYFLLIPMLFPKNIISTLILIKDFIAFLNVSILLYSVWKLTRFFSYPGIFTAFAFTFFSEMALTYSTNIRVDLLSYWFCFFSLLYLLENRFLLAGFLLGMGFITSQKAVWYILASQSILLIQFLYYSREYLIASRRNFNIIKKSSLSHVIKNALQLNGMMAFIIISYLVVWSIISDWHTVFNNVFYEAQMMYQLDWYNNVRKFFWSYILLNNPLLFLLSPLTLISLCVTFPQDKHYFRRAAIIAYAITILLCLVFYKQVFPYYMQVVIPVFFILYAAFFSWLSAIFIHGQSPVILIGKHGLWAILILYISVLISIIIFLKLPFIYLIIFFIPLMIGLYLTNFKEKNTKFLSLYFNLIYLSMIFTGAVYPLTLLGIKLVNINGNYQKANIRMVNTLLQDGSSYVAGIELIYNKTQSISGMRHLMGPAIDYLISPSKKLRSIMLASLYEDPNATIDSVIDDLKKSPVKFYVNNYRMIALPNQIKNYLDANYQHWWGSIYLYAPYITAGKHSIWLEFSGNYLLDANKKTSIQINHEIYATQSIVSLHKRNYLFYSATNFRLKLIPEQNASLKRKFYEDKPYQLIF